MATGPDALVQPKYKDRSGWLIAFGAVDIFFGLVSLLVVVVLYIIPLSLPQGSGPGEVSDVWSAVFFAGAAVVLAFAVCLLLSGIGSILRRNWARITMLVVSPIWLAAGVALTVYFAVAGPPAIGFSGHPALATIQMTILLVRVSFGLTMIVVPAAFLLFYSRKSVKATCLG
ncbi:MAG: hypothetical protein KGM47_19025 [Acidobacteriota bacterium]|nr:hypothetical protein [Acidobacteriota bacterium]